MDGGGTIGHEELYELGKARRRLGQKKGSWTKGQNMRMIARMDKDGDGEVEEGEFVTFFNSTLSPERPEFDQTMEQFMTVAQAVARAKRDGGTWISPDSAPTSPAGSPVSSPRSPRLARGDEYEQHRTQSLAALFDEFDLDSSGAITKEELQKLGEARRSLGQKKGAWTEEQNARLVAKIDQDGNGLIEKEEFVTHFNRALARERFEFDNTMVQFMQVAKLSRRAKRP